MTEAERLRVVEGEREEWRARALSNAEQCDRNWAEACRAVARAESAEAALAELRAGVEALADEWDESSASGHPDCAHDEDCVGCGADDLRALLGGAS